MQQRVPRFGRTRSVYLPPLSGSGAKYWKRKNIEKGEKAWADMADSAESFEETDLRRSGEDCARNQAAKNDEDPKDYLGVPMLRRCAAKLSSSRTAGTNLFGPSDRGNTCYPCLGSKYQRQQEAQQQRKQQYLVGW